LSALVGSSADDDWFFRRQRIVKFAIKYGDWVKSRSANPRANQSADQAMPADLASDEAYLKSQKKMFLEKDVELRQKYSDKLSSNQIANAITALENKKLSSGGLNPNEKTQLGDLKLLVAIELVKDIF
jgi:hypothetical protein